MERGGGDPSYYFLVPLLGLSYPVYKTLIWTIRWNAADQRACFYNYLLKECGFFVYRRPGQSDSLVKQVGRGCVLSSIIVYENSNYDTIQAPSRPVHFSDTSIVIKENADYRLELRWDTKFGGEARFLGWSAKKPAMLLTPLASRAEMMDIFHQFHDQLEPS